MSVSTWTVSFSQVRFSKHREPFLLEIVSAACFFLEQNGKIKIHKEIHEGLCCPLWDVSYARSCCSLNGAKIQPVKIQATRTGQAMIMTAWLRDKREISPWTWMSVVISNIRTSSQTGTSAAVGLLAPMPTSKDWLTPEIIQIETVSKDWISWGLPPWLYGKQGAVQVISHHFCLFFLIVLINLKPEQA